MVDLWGWGRGRGNRKGFLTPSLRKAVFVRQGRGILYQIFSYSGGTDTRNYGATRQAASDDQGMRLLQQMFKEPSRHVYKRVALGLDFADWMIVIRIRKQPKNSVRIEKFSNKCWKKSRIELVLLMSLCDWSRFKTETSRDLVARVFTSSSHWLLVIFSVLWLAIVFVWFYDTQWKSALSI